MTTYKEYDIALCLFELPQERLSSRSEDSAMNGIMDTKEDVPCSRAVPACTSCQVSDRENGQNVDGQHPDKWDTLCTSSPVPFEDH